MSQNDFTLANQSFPAFRADLNSALQALASNNSGTSAPSTTFANMWWYDSSNNIMYIRNEDNDAWIKFAELDQTNDKFVLSGTLQLDDGTVSAPALTFNSDTNMGIYRGGTDILKFVTAGTDAITIDASQNVDVNGTVTADGLNVQGDGTISGGSRLTISDIADVNNDGIRLDDSTTSRFNNLTQNSSGEFLLQHFTGSAWQNNLTVTTSGDLLVGKTAISVATVGVEARADGIFASTRSGGEAIRANRTSSDGDIIQLRKDNTTVGSIGSEGGDSLYIVSGDTGLRFSGGADIIIPASTAGASRDNAIDLGSSGARFKNLYLSGGIGGDATISMSFAPGGNIGVGNTGPGYPLDVGTSSLDKRARFQGNNQYRLALQNGTNNLVWLGSGGADNFRISNSAGATVFEIDSSGAVTMPNQPAFQVNPSSNQLNMANGDTLIFDQEKFDQNSDFSSNTFTAPVTGKYQLQLTARVDQLDRDANWVRIEMVTSNRSYEANIIDPDAFDKDPDQWSFNFSVLADMDASDTVFLRWGQSGGANTADLDTQAHFSGYLVA